MEVRLIKWRYGFPLNVTPYELGREIGMALDTVPNALEELKVVYSNRKLTITPWLVRENTHDLYWTDSGGNFIAEFSKQDIQEVERGIREWLREWRESTVLGKLGKQVWPTKSNPAVPEAVIEKGQILSIENPKPVNKALEGKRVKVYEVRPDGRLAAHFVDKADIQRWSAKIYIFDRMELLPKPPAVSVVDYDRCYSLEELREMARQAGLSPSGSKKEIAARLIAKGVK